MFASIEFVVVVLQWKTGGVLGLSFLGVPTQLTARTTDTSELGRPFGTIIHPVFMGAVMGSLGLMAVALGLTLKRSLLKVAALGMALVCTLPLYLAHTRAALVAFVLVILVMVGGGHRPPSAPVALGRAHLRGAAHRRRRLLAAARRRSGRRTSTPGTSARRSSPARSSTTSPGG